MKKRSVGSVLLFFLAIMLIVTGILAYRAAHVLPRTPVFRLREVTSYDMTGHQPMVVYGNRMVDAEFDYVGPDLFPSISRFRMILMRFGLARPPLQVPMTFGDVTLSDEHGKLLATLNTNSPLGATTTTARCGYSPNGQADRVTFQWTFILPPTVDPSRPAEFSTTLSVNQATPVPVPVRVIIAPVTPPTSAPSP